MRWAASLLPRALLAVGLATAAAVAAAAAPRCYTGAEFPAPETWLPFDALWARWAPVFAGEDGGGNGNSAAENDAVRAGLLSGAGEGGFAPQFALAVVVTESWGRVRASCGDGGVSCGIFQVKGTQNPCAGQPGPCPAEAIGDMCRCGMLGCAGARGTNLRQCLGSEGGDYGRAARLYNTGSVPDARDLTVAPYGTRQYVHWVANVLTGADAGQLADVTTRCGLWSAGVSG